MKKTCPCCGYKTLTSESNDICDICFWKDVEVRQPDIAVEPNDVSLMQAQRNFLRFKACNERFIESVRTPTENDVRDPAFSWCKVYVCPCCGYKNLSSEIFDICDICWWEDDPSQRDAPDYFGGPNGKLTLRQAQKNFIAFGACEELFIEKARKPNEDDVKDPNFKLFL